MSNFSYGAKMGTDALLGGSRRKVLVCILKALLVLALTLSSFSVKTAPAPAEGGPQLEWETSFGWQGYRCRVVDVAQSDDGGYLVVVEKRLDVDWRSDTYVATGACVVKIDAIGQKVWEKELVEDCDRVGNALRTADGGLIIGFSAKSPGSSTDLLLRDMAVIKVDSSGNKVWEKAFGGENDDYLSSVGDAGDGGCLVAGSSNSFSSKGDYDLYLVRLDASGEKIWENAYGGEDDDFGQFVCVGDDGGSLIAGNTFSKTSGDIEDVYVVKTDADGNKVWEKTFGGKGPDTIAAVQRTSDGGLVMAGVTGSFPGWENIYLIKVDASGNSSWQKAFGRDGDFHDYGISVRETKDGGFIVLGNTVPFGEGKSVLLIKTDARGNKTWERIFQDREYMWGSEVELSGEGYIISGGEHDQQDGPVAYVIKTDSKGEVLWKKTLGKGIIEPAVVLSPAHDKGYLAAGVSLGWNGAIYNLNYNIYMAKLGSAQTGREETGAQTVKVYLDGNQMFFDVPPVIEDGRAMAPLRAIGEALGAEVGWEGQSQVVTLDMPATNIELKIGDPVAHVNGIAVVLDVPAKIINGRTLVPLRFVSEYFGAGVQWDGGSRVITIATNPGKSMPQAALNPNSALPALTWTGEKPQLPAFTAWEYAAQPEPPLDIEELLARIWPGQGYESFDHGEGGMYYRLPLYQSKYGKFSEELDTWRNGFSYRWEINENYPKRRAMDISPEQAFEQAGAYAREFLGDDRYTKYPLPFAATVDEDGRRIDHFYEFNWERRIGSVPVHGEGLSLRVIPEGIPQLRLNWSAFAPLGAEPQYKPLTFDQALSALNYVRGCVDPQKCSEHSADDFLVSAQVVYSNFFSEDPAVYRPVWEFTLSRSSKFHPFPILVDCLTGKVWSNHDGIVESYLKERQGMSGDGIIDNNPNSR